MLLHLSDLQFLCFVSHNFSARSARIGFLAKKGKDIKLCWLVVKQTFKYQEENDLSNMELVEIDIKFKLPVLDSIGGVYCCEFVNLPGKSLQQSNEGVLVIQNWKSIFISDNATGNW